MGDRYRYNSGRRSPTFNPARMSMPTMSSGYSSFYGGDIHVMPSSRYESVLPQQSHHHHHRHGSNDWRGPNVPVTTTTYTVRKDPVTRSSSIRENSRTRSSTMDSTTKRPPIIVTTRQSKEPSVSHGASSHHPASPAPDRGRDAYRSSDEDQYYTQPASSIRSRSHTRPYPASGSISSTLDNDEFLRLRQRTNDDRLAPSRNGHRRERPSSIYADAPRLSTKTVDLGDTGYEYTNPSDLARYDLDNDKVHTRRRRDSFDRNTYYRPSVNVGTDVTRPYEGRVRAPPPSRALDNYNRRIAEDSTAGIYDRPSVRMPAPPVIPVPAPDRRSSQLDIPPSPVERPDRIEQRPSRTGHRPVSLYQDGPLRASQPEDLYRARDDHYGSRDHRDRDYQRDEGVGNRGFGVRVDGDKKDDRLREREREEFPSVRERRTEQRRDSRVDDWEREPKRRSDDDLTHREARKYGRDQGRKEDDHRADNRKTGKDDYARGEDERNRDRDREREKEKEKDKDKIRDKVATGLSIAAGALGLGAMSHKSKDEEEKERSPKRRADDEARKDEAEERQKPPRKEADERPIPRDETEERPGRERDLDGVDDKERNRHEAEARLSGEPTMTGARDASSSDESKPRRRRRPSSAFRPNDTAGLMALKEQLKAKEESDKENEKAANDESSPERHPQPSPPKRGAEPGDDIRGREAITGGDDKQVRVVSPPRDKDDKKPIKGILKQPKVQFPEEPNPVREGVAPHKDDKSKSNVPPGARWTKISRKLVNPEALTIGKERFEVRDDFVIVLRVLNKEEIEAYTAATAQLREMRRQEYDREQERDRDDDDDDDDRRRPHRSHRRDPRDEEEDEKKRREDKIQREREKERERERDARSKRYRPEEDEEPRRLEYYADDTDRGGLPHRSHRHREREREKVPVSVRPE